MFQFVGMVLVIFLLTLFTLLFIAILLSVVAPKKAQKIFDKFSRKNYCKICGKQTHDKLSAGINQKSDYFCRIHLLEEYKNKIISTPFNYLQIEYQSDLKGHTLDYAYYPISKMRKLGWEEKEKEVLNQIIMSIKTSKCSKCDKKSQVLFISAQEISKNDYDPRIKEEYLKMGKLLCPQHSLDISITSIQNGKKRFDNWGLGFPHEEDGFQMTVIV